MEWPSKNDLWVEAKGYEGRLLLEENAHTHLGHIHAWSEVGEFSTTINLPDVTAASPLAAAWLAGFLTGSEPELGEFLGVSEVQADEDTGIDPTLLDDWFQALERYRQVGWLPPRDMRPTCEVVDPITPLTPWAPAGGRVWQYEPERGWFKADSQLELNSYWRYIVRTLCAEREEHGDVEESFEYIICIDCGYLEERGEPWVEPE